MVGKGIRRIIDKFAPKAKEDRSTGSFLGSMFVIKGKGGEPVWVGIHTNKFLDDDIPPDVLSESAHKDFIARVYKGETPWPELWVWHLPTKIGDVKFLGWDDSGFVVSAGTFVDPSWGLALAKSAVPLAMSHGFYDIARDEKESYVIVSYTTHEISVLPAGYAANKYTGFVTNIGESKMIASEQRESLMEMLGEEMVEELELSLQAAGHKAVSEGKVFKSAVWGAGVTETVNSAATEDNADGEDGDENAAAVEAEAVPVEKAPEEGVPEEEDPEEPKAEIPTEPDAEPEEGGEEGVENEAGPEEEPPADLAPLDQLAVVQAELAQISEAFTTVVEAMGVALSQLSEKGEALEEKQRQIEEKIAALEKATAPALADERSKTVHGALASFMEKVGNSSAYTSAIGSKGALASPKLAKAAPEQAEEKEGGRGPGLFIDNWTHSQRS